MTIKQLNKLLDDMADSIEVGIAVAQSFAKLNSKYTNAFHVYVNDIEYTIEAHYYGDNNEVFIDLLLDDEGIFEDVIHINDLKISLHYKLICMIGHCLSIAKYHNM